MFDSIKVVQWNTVAEPIYHFTPTFPKHCPETFVYKINQDIVERGDMEKKPYPNKFTELAW